MRELAPIVITAMILAFLSEWNSSYELDRFGEKVYIKKDKLFFTIMAVVMIVFVGLRTSYNDTYAYTRAYNLIASDFSGLNAVNWKIGDNPGFNITNIILKYLGVSTQNFLMFYAIVSVGTYLWFLRKYTTNIWISVFLFFTMGCYTFTMAAIKQCVAVAFCLIAVDCALQKKWVSFGIWVLLACTFHPYALMYTVTPFLIFRPWTRRTFILLGTFGIAGIGLESMLGTLINITTLMGEEYDMASFTGDGVNVFRLAVVWVPVILSFMARKFWQESEDEKANVIMNLTLLNAEIMFIALFGTANYFARLANYFLIFQTLLMPRLFKYFRQNSKRFLQACAIGGYCMYFYYASGILYGGFDKLYKGIGLLDYLRTMI